MDGLKFKITTKVKIISKNSARVKINGRYGNAILVDLSFNLYLLL